MPVGIYERTPQMYDSRRGKGNHNFGKDFRGSKSPSWKGGIHKSKGYIWIYEPKHPFQKKGYVKRCRLIMERYLGRYISREERVHHKNGIKDDDRLINLQYLPNESIHSYLSSKSRHRDKLGRFTN